MWCVVTVGEAVEVKRVEVEVIIPRRCLHPDLQQSPEPIISRELHPSYSAFWLTYFSFVES